MNGDESIRAIDHQITILIPVYNDWDSLNPLLTMIDETLLDHELSAGILVIDDGSTADPPSQWNNGHAYLALPKIELLTIKRNLGHQRALAIGIAHAEHRGTCDELIVMDGDGEDDPRDIPRLIARSRSESGRSIVFAERTRRSESLGFRVFYHLYKALHRLLIGQKVRVGNFSLIPRSRLASLSVVSELWIHYAAAAFRSRQPVSFLPTVRAKRLRGKSRMNFSSLVMHGLSAISVNGDLMAVRLLIVMSALGLMDLSALAVTSHFQLGGSLAVPPSWIFIGLGVLLLNLMAMTVGFLILILSGRLISGFLPKRDHMFYHEGVRPLLTIASSSRSETPRSLRATSKTMEFRHVPRQPL